MYSMPSRSRDSETLVVQRSPLKSAGCPGPYLPTCVQSCKRVWIFLAVQYHCNMLSMQQYEEDGADLCADEQLIPWVAFEGSAQQLRQSRQTVRAHRHAGPDMLPMQGATRACR